MTITAMNKLVVGYLDPTTGENESYEVAVLAWKDLDNATKALRRTLVEKALHDPCMDEDELPDLIMDIFEIEPWVQTRERVEGT